MPLYYRIFAALDRVVAMTHFKPSATLRDTGSAIQTLAAHIAEGDVSNPRRLTALFLQSALHEPGELARLLTGAADFDFIAARSAWIHSAPATILPILRYHLTLVAEAILMGCLDKIGRKPVDITVLESLALLTHEPKVAEGLANFPRNHSLIFEVDEHNHLVPSQQFYRARRGGTDGSLQVQAHTSTKAAGRLSVKRHNDEFGIYVSANDPNRRFQLRMRPALFDIAKENFSIPEPA